MSSVEVSGRHGGPVGRSEVSSGASPSGERAGRVGEGAKLKAHRWFPWELMTFVRDPYAFFAEHQRRYGDTYLMRSALGPIYLSSDPAVAKAVFTAGTERVDHFGGDMLAAVLGDKGLLVTAGETHKRSRQLLAPAFMGKRMRALEEHMQRAALERLATWKAGDTVDVGPEMEQIALDVILSVVLGMTGERHEALRRNIKETLGLVTAEVIFLRAFRVRLGGLTRFGRLMKNRERARALLDAEIAERRASGEDRGTVLDSMLAARDDEGQAFTDDEIFDQVLTLLVAGHETTATALSWAFFHLLADGDYAAQMKAAAQEAGPSAHGLATDPFIGRACKETLRLTPIIPEVPRLIMSDFVAGGVHFEAGKRLMLAVPALHRRADVFEHPEQFLPERFEDQRYAPWEFAPFGGGVRKCIGWAFALQQMAIILGTVFARFDLALADPRPPVPGRRNLSVGPKGGVKLKVVAAR